jgi:hypothetical protein
MGVWLGLETNPMEAVKIVPIVAILKGIENSSGWDPKPQRQ